MKNKTTFSQCDVSKVIYDKTFQGKQAAHLPDTRQMSRATPAGSSA